MFVVSVRSGQFLEQQQQRHISTLTHIRVSFHLLARVNITAIIFYSSVPAQTRRQAGGQADRSEICLFNVEQHRQQPQ